MEKKFQSIPRGDASPLTTSTESETFETWTLITEKQNDDVQYTSIPPDRCEDGVDVTDTDKDKCKDNDNDNDNETVAKPDNRVKVYKTSNVTVETRFNDIDDLSDGISIISDCESNGRVTPHPELRKHLSGMNTHFISATEQPSPSSATEESTTLNYEACSERSSDTFHRVEPLNENPRRQRKISRQLVEPTESQPTLRSSLRGLFYVGALLAVLAFISKIKYDSWDLVFDSKVDLLEQKLDALELNNNLMRAEIDILTKQVNYLTTLSENQKYTSSSSKPPKKENKIKVWPGNGNKIEQMEVAPNDLKQPFSHCEDPATCIDVPPSKYRIDLISKEFMDNLEKVADIVHYTQDGKQVSDSPPATDKAPKADTLAEYVSREHKPPQYEAKKHDKRSPDTQRKQRSKHDSSESKEHRDSNNQRRDKSSEDRNDSGERHKKSKDHKKYEKRFPTPATSYDYDKEKREADGQWHEKLMLHRENARKSNDKHRHDKNWYMERADSREEARVSDQKYRPIGER